MRGNERGVALIGVLAVVGIVALITLSALERGMLQTRTVTAALDRARALEAAEFALRRAADHATDWSRSSVDPVPPPHRDAWQPVIRARGRPVSGAPHNALLDRAPEVLVERLRPIGSNDCSDGDCGYRLTALADNRDDGADVVLQARIIDGSAVRIWRVLR
ncbi:pilus assembly PilX family protein [Spiribacter vilamensis]|uniref:Type IV pilus assembly protein PilX n=1 Tax=Spiribacter vilamensis TaxID=531306 RepID=A0A4Q8CYR0_9GAMM|nr:hypothetical protein [Spiribacter vilamensis]RZU98037.1 hypothetical protein EV698_0273 [Spiribacter vilamensis]TVO61058.1 hypothetical protein FPL09_02565 [Spiribacter vilamensis]